MEVGLLIALIVLLVVGAAALIFLMPVEEHPGAEPEERPALITQPYAAGQPVEQPTSYFAAPIPESPDPLEVAANLDKKAALATAMLFGTLVMLAGYYLFSADLRAVAAERQLETTAARGANLYAGLCFDCHGARGEGIPGVGFPLNRADLRATCDTQGEPAPETDECRISDDNRIRQFLTRTIERGRERPPPAYSMPAWAQTEAGPLSAEQIRQLVAFIMYGDWEEVADFRAEQELGPEPQVPPPPREVVGVELGMRVAQQTCSACHSFQRDRDSVLPQAPNLWNYATAGPFQEALQAKRDAGEEDWLLQWVRDAPSIKPDTPMPRFADELTPAQIEGVVEYLESLTGEEE